MAVAQTIIDDDWSHLIDVTDATDVLPTEIEDTCITLHPPSQIYKVMYSRAKKKAQALKASAIQAILEANSIKNSYMLNESVSGAGGSDGFDSDGSDGSDVSDLAAEIE